MSNTLPPDKKKALTYALLQVAYKLAVAEVEREQAQSAGSGNTEQATPKQEGDHAAEK